MGSACARLISPTGKEDRKISNCQRVNSYQAVTPNEGCGTLGLSPSPWGPFFWHRFLFRVRLDASMQNPSLSAYISITRENGCLDEASEKPPTTVTSQCFSTPHLHQRTSLVVPNFSFLTTSQG